MSILTARFWAKVDAPDLLGCWVWTGARSSRGYGQWGVNGVSKSIHRLIYVDRYGPIPEGLVLDHLCRNRACCNPTHLEAVTSKVNSQRGEPATKTHCVHGHPLSGPNLIRRDGGDGQRECRTCANAWRRQKRAALRLADIEALVARKHAAGAA